MKFSDLKEFDNHEAIVFATDKKTGLKTFVAIHSTILGPATGGTRFWHYESENDALIDALKLSRAMTYKCALADVPFGGGKGVILKESKLANNTTELFTAYAKKINLLSGNFTTGEDVGLSQHDVEIMGKASPYINGTSTKGGGLDYWATLGVFESLRAGLIKIFGNDSCKDKTFAVKGLGKIGLGLSERILKAGGNIIASDIEPEAIIKAKKLFPDIKFAKPEDIYKQSVDVFCPCALGGDLNPQTIPELKCKLICGGANNQLACMTDGETIHQSGILYIPDYVANAGGLIRAVAQRMPQGFNETWVSDKVCNIFNTASEIIKLSSTMDLPTSEVADSLAKKKLKQV